MERVRRARRWRPIFTAAHDRGTLFFYAGLRQPGAAAFFHRHQGDRRPHLHLVEGPHQDHDPRQEREHGHELGAGRFHSHECDVRESAHGKPDDRAGHWHFAFPVADADTANRPPYFCQVLALDWLIVIYGSQDQAPDLRLAIDHLARPPP